MFTYVTRYYLQDTTGQLIYFTFLSKCSCFSEFGKSPSVVSFEGNHIGVRRSDGALVNSIISPHVPVLHNFTAAQLWPDALRLCRSLKVSRQITNLVGIVRPSLNDLFLNIQGLKDKILILDSFFYLHLKLMLFIRTLVHDNVSLSAPCGFNCVSAFTRTAHIRGCRPTLIFVRNKFQTCRFYAWNNFSLEIHFEIFSSCGEFEIHLCVNLPLTFGYS